MKEFHILLANCTNKKQLERYLQDAYNEMKRNELSIYKCGAFFNRAYGLDFDVHRMLELGHFIESGDYKWQMELYRH